jgi:hypothetical protein
MIAASSLLGGRRPGGFATTHEASMATVLDAPKTRILQPVLPAPVVTPRPAVTERLPATNAAYRPDLWGLWFWLACAAVLLLLQVFDSLAALWNMLF